jgi:hypothetical protein
VLPEPQGLQLREQRLRPVLEWLRGLPEQPRRQPMRRGPAEQQELQQRLEPEEQQGRPKA